MEHCNPQPDTPAGAPGVPIRWTVICSGANAMRCCCAFFQDDIHQFLIGLVRIAPPNIAMFRTSSNE
jgi:hypothetical protein